MIWYKHYAQDFIGGVVGLGADAIGCYIVVLDLIYLNGGPIKHDARWISGILGCSTRLTESLLQRLEKAGKLVIENGTVNNVRAEFELKNQAEISRNKREAGAYGGRKRAENDRRMRENNDLAQADLKLARARREENRVERTSTNVDVCARASDAPPPPKGSTPREELLKALDRERAEAVIEHRQRLRSPLTSRAAKMLAGKFAECPDPNAAADEMLAAGWLSIEPEWLARRKQSRGTGPPRRGNGELTPNQRQMLAFDEVFGNDEEPEDDGASPQGLVPIASPGKGR